MRFRGISFLFMALGLGCRSAEPRAPVWSGRVTSEPPASGTARSSEDVILPEEP